MSENSVLKNLLKSKVKKSQPVDLIRPVKVKLQLRSKLPPFFLLQTINSNFSEVISLYKFSISLGSCEPSAS